VTTAVVALTGEEALKLVAGAPDISGKTPAELREAADQFEEAATRKDRLVVTDGGGRRGARSKARQREGEKLRLQAQVTRSAAVFCLEGGAHIAAALELRDLDAEQSEREAGRQS
jgi:hypothetical protein